MGVYKLLADRHALEYARDYALLQRDEVNILLNIGDLDQIVSAQLSELQAFEALAPGSNAHWYYITSVSRDIANTYVERQDWSLAEGYYQKAMDAYHNSQSGMPGYEQDSDEMNELQNSLARVEIQEGKFDEAARIATEAKLSAEHDRWHTLSRTLNIARSLVTIGTINLGEQKYSDARTSFRAAGDLLKPVLDRVYLNDLEPVDKSEIRRLRVSCFLGVASAEGGLKSWVPAEAAYKAAAQLISSKESRSENSAKWIANSLIQTYLLLISLYQAENKTVEVRATCSEALSVAQEPAMAVREKFISQVTNICSAK